MIRRLGIWPAVFALLGLALFTGTIAFLGWGDVMHALEKISLTGFMAYLGVQMMIVAGLSLAWRLLLRKRAGGTFFLLYWGRMVRDSAGQFLPFSHIGGFIVGARAIALHGVSFADAAASTLADVTLEFLAELVFVAIGILCLVGIAPHSELVLPMTFGLGCAIAGGAAFLLMQKGMNRMFSGLAMRIAGRSADGAAIGMQRLQDALDAIYARRLRLAGAAFMHLVCWFGTGLASYVAFDALGHPIPLIDALSIEALLHAILATGFFVPGRIGVQEAAYTLLGAVFGIPPDIALSVSLLRRARDLIIAIPVLLVWQGLEARRLQPVAGRSG